MCPDLYMTVEICFVLCRDLDVLLPDIDYVEIPVDWWNADADKSLLIGVFKHGISFYVGWTFCRHSSCIKCFGGNVLLLVQLQHPLLPPLFSGFHESLKKDMPVLRVVLLMHTSIYIRCLNKEQILF